MQNLVDCGVFPEFRILLNLLTSMEKVMEKYTFKGNFTVRNYKQNVQTGPKIIRTFYLRSGELLLIKLPSDLSWCCLQFVKRNCLEPPSQFVHTHLIHKKGDFFNCPPPLVQNQNEKGPMSQPDSP